MLTSKEFIQRVKIIHQNRYDYSNTNYKGLNYSIEIICSKHGKFSKIAHDHLHEHSGCPKCRTYNNRLTTEEFILRANRIHDERYDYSKINYINSNTLVIIICKIHGNFKQLPKDHLKDHGCPYCNNFHSKGEAKINNYLKLNNINFIPQHRFKNCKNILTLPFDYYLPKYNTCIEYDGEQHYKPVKCFGGISEFKKTVVKDDIKNKFCIKNNIKLIRIPYTELTNIELILDNNLLIV